MANMCSNTLFFWGDEENLKQMRKTFKKMIEKQSFDNIGVLPGFASRDKKGFFFDIFTIDFEVIYYETKWVENIEEVLEIAKRYNLNFSLEYEELGNLLVGKTIYQDGNIVEYRLAREDFDKVIFDEETSKYKFEGGSYESMCDIFNIILSRK